MSQQEQERQASASGLPSSAPIPGRDTPQSAGPSSSIPEQADESVQSMPGSDVGGSRDGDPEQDPSQRIVARGTTRTPPPPVDLSKQEGPPQPPGRTDLIGQGLIWLSQWSLRLLLVGAAAVLLVLAIAKLWVIVLPLFLALLLSTVLQPPVELLRRKGVPGALAAGLVVLSALLLLVGIIAAIAPSVAGQAGEIADRVSGGLQSIQDWVAGPPFNLSDAQFAAAVDAAQERLSGNASTIASGVFSGLGAASSALVTTVLVLVLTFFMLKDGAKFTPWLAAVVGRAAGRHLTLVLRRCYGTLGSFIRTQLLVSFIDALFIGIGLLILRVPLALPLTVLTFFGGLVPIVGALFAGGVAVLVTLVANGLTSALIVLGLIVLVQQLEGNVLSPILQSRSLSLHPAVVILAVTAGGTIFGIVGAFLAVPTVAVLAQALRYLDELADATAAAATESMAVERRRLSLTPRRRARPDAAGPDPAPGTDSGPTPEPSAVGAPTPTTVLTRARGLLPWRPNSDPDADRDGRAWPRLRR